MASRDTTESIEAKPKSALYTRAPTRPRRPRSEARPAEGRKRANVPRRAPPTGRARRLPEAHTMAGRGSAERSRAARPRWVMMEISRVARASTAERSGSSSGACCRRNGKTSVRILAKFRNFRWRIQKIRKISTFSKISAKFRQNFIKI